MLPSAVEIQTGAKKTLAARLGLHLLTRQARHFWNSPTLTTWLSLGVRSLSLLAILPLLTRSLSDADLVFSQVSLSLGYFQLLLDMGLSPTFTRLIAHASAGSGAESVKAVDLIDMQRDLQFIFRILATISLVLLPTLGTLLVIRPLADNLHSMPHWVAWGVVVLTSPLMVSAIPFTVFLTGLGDIPVIRRSEAMLACCSLASAWLVLTLGWGVYGFMISNQIWVVLVYFRMRQMAQKRIGLWRAKLPPDYEYRSRWDHVWPQAWRSGVGVLLTSAPTQLAGVLYAQTDAGPAIAKCLVAMRYLNSVNQFAQAPFYSRIPQLNRLKAEGRDGDVLKSAYAGMRGTYATLVLGVVALAWGLPILLRLWGSGANPVMPGFWWMMSFALLIERFSAMHLHLYSTTNVIVWHIANGGAGLLYMLGMAVSFPWFGAMALPIGMLFGNLVFFAWYTSGKSRTAFGFPLVRTELTSFLPALLFLSLNAALHIFLLPRLGR